MGDGTTPRGDDVAEPRRLRQLRWLVTALTLTLMFGVIAIVALLVIRLGAFGGGRLALPDEIRLPAGERTRAVTLGTDWVAVVTVDGDGQERVRVLDRSTGADLGTVEIHPFD
jgi:hypothetical protein